MIIDNSCLPGSFNAEPSEVLSRIPQDALALIFSQLSLNEISNLRLSNRFWSCASTSYIKTHFLALPKLFVSFLSENQLELSGLSTEGSLLEISDQMLVARDQLVDVLKGFDLGSLLKLQTELKIIPKPFFFDKLIELAKIMQTVDGNWKTIGRATLVLSFLGCSNKAFRLLNSMPDLMIGYSYWHYDDSKSAKFATFRLRMQQHSCMGLFDKIMEVAKSIISQDAKFITFDHLQDYLNSLKVICGEFVKANKRDRADEVLNLIPSLSDKKIVQERMNQVKILGRRLGRNQITELQINLENDGPSTESRLFW